ncbi:ribonuclease R [Sedimentibacter sp. zth1]|uniref:ribonuclease R n=1 Tax=Sedimentibacter sp. zth1 TaxID=2816908 RepID=UPI001A91FAF3|nr:ribonuclease R [Sedimentibacter sp. zth1]QSX06246.1 ribonuclease R [Sedimentibacter sp. zth1]
MNFKEKILAFMLDEEYRPLTFKQLCDLLEVESSMRKELLRLLNELEEEGKILLTNTERYAIPEKMGLIMGVIEGNQKGYGFLIPNNKDIRDIFISPVDLNGAMHGDKVFVKSDGNSYDDKSPEGKVVKILERVNKTIIGAFQQSKSFGFVVPDDNKIGGDIFISKGDFNGAKNNQKVVVKITEWPKGRRSAEGEIIEVIGNQEDTKTHIDAVLIRHKVRQFFSADVLSQAKGIEKEIPDSEIKRRKDLRNEIIITIDGKDAKDLDDAVSVVKIDDNKYKLGVHIADVTHYVKENSKIDKEALKRATSIYLADKVIPMLPKELSNGVCSLNPNEDKLTLSCEMIIDTKGKVVDYQIFESIIKTKFRMNYTDVSNIIENDDEELKVKYKEILTMIDDMKELSYILKTKRENRGCIDFDFDETKLIVDKDGKITDVTKYERRTSNRIIEEFMLAANETIAENYYWLNIPFVYRIHEEPDEEKMMEFSKFIFNFGYTLKGSQEVHPRELQQLLAKVSGKKEETVINTMMLRSLKKARYANECAEHFGLAATYYCHFTSPIRRYPDLQIHRIIKAQLNNKISLTDNANLMERCALVADQSSKQERYADEIERDTNKIRIAEFMADKVGEEYEGVISGVTGFGIFVELDNTVEGLVHISNLDDDYYIYDANNKVLNGRVSHKTYKIGDVVKVRLDRVSIPNAEIDFAIIDKMSN